MELKIGFISSVVAAFSFIIFTLCFVAIIITQEPVAWTNLTDYIQSVNKNSQVFKYIAQCCSLCFGLAYLIILNSLENIVSPDKVVLLKISRSFGTIFTTLIAMNYFLQLTTIRFSMQSGETELISNWVMFNPHSVILSIAMLGWTVMFGLSSLFVAPVFEGQGISKAIRILFIANGAFCLIGGIAFVLQNTALVNLTINLGMGGTTTVLSIILARYFWISKDIESNGVRKTKASPA